MTLFDTNENKYQMVRFALFVKKSKKTARIFCNLATNKIVWQHKMFILTKFISMG